MGLSETLFSPCATPDLAGRLGSGGMGLSNTMFSPCATSDLAGLIFSPLCMAYNSTHSEKPPVSKYESDCSNMNKIYKVYYYKKPKKKKKKILFNFVGEDPQRNLGALSGITGVTYIMIKCVQVIDILKDDDEL